MSISKVGSITALGNQVNARYVTSSLGRYSALLSEIGLKKPVVKMIFDCGESCLYISFCLARTQYADYGTSVNISVILIFFHPWFWWTLVDITSQSTTPMD